MSEDLPQHRPFIRNLQFWSLRDKAQVGMVLKQSLPSRCRLDRCCYCKDKTAVTAHFSRKQFLLFPFLPLQRGLRDEW